MTQLASNAPYLLAWFEKIDQSLKSSVKSGLPGAIVGIFMNDTRVFHGIYGYQRLYNERTLMPTPEPMHADTIFDLASLTKIFSTTLCYMKLVGDGLINLTDPVSRFFPDYKGFGKEAVTIAHLFHHESGLPATHLFYRPELAAPGFYSQDRERTMALLPKVPLQQPPGTAVVYSDINFMLLGVILEKVTSMRQDAFSSKYLYEPLGLKHTGYRLLDKGFPKNRFEATERCGNTREGTIHFPNVRTKTIQGEVQDEKAYYSMGGVSAHAGLFSTLDELHILAKLVLNKGNYEKLRLCNPKIVDVFLNTFNTEQSYAIGFQIPSLETTPIYGKFPPPLGTAYGHTGWTGTCFLIDFKKQVIILILNNKKHSPFLQTPDENTFEADLLPISHYGPLIQLFYGAFIPESSP